MAKLRSAREAACDKETLADNSYVHFLENSCRLLNAQNASYRFRLDRRVRKNAADARGICECYRGNRLKVNAYNLLHLTQMLTLHGPISWTSKPTDVSCVDC